MSQNTDAKPASQLEPTNKILVAIIHQVGRYRLIQAVSFSDQDHGSSEPEQSG